MYVRRHVVVIITQMVFLEELCSFSTNSGIRLVLTDYNFILVHADNVLVSLKFWIFQRTSPFKRMFPQQTVDTSYFQLMAQKCEGSR